MGSPCPPHWSFAARAAYFGDRMCAFCGHRNPAGARFCNDCAAPLHLKPCKQCDAVNDQAATNCYKCGAACPVSVSAPDATPVFPAADSPPAWAAAPDVAGGTTVTQPPLVAPALPAAGRLRTSGQVIAAAVATVLIVAAYAAYRVNVAKPRAIGVASEPVAVRENNATTAATPAPPVVLESMPVEPERTAALPASIPATHAEAPKRASARERPVPVPATKREGAHQRPVPAPDTSRIGAHQRSIPGRQAPARATPPEIHGPAKAHVGAPVAQTRKATGPDPWQAMHVSLARCDGDLIARVVCDQRVRRQFCEGRWGEMPECASGVANDHGQ